MIEDLRVSNSRVKSWRKCQNKHYYRYVMKIERKRKNLNFTVGGLFHECTEDMSNGKSFSSTIKRYRDHLTTLMDEERVLYEEAIDLAEGMARNYSHKYKEDDYEVTGIEVPIEYEIADGINFIGYIDKKILTSDGKLAIMEHKTCKTIPDESVRLTDIQTLLYVEGLEKLGMGKCKEIIWDYSRKKLPVIPQTLVKGGLSKRKDIDTTYKVYLKAIADNKLKISDYKDLLKNLKSKSDTFFRRIKYPVSKHQVKLIVSDFIKSSIEIKHLGETSRIRNFDFQCGNCEYYQLCTAETMNVDTDFILKKQFKERTNEENKKRDPF